MIRPTIPRSLPSAATAAIAAVGANASPDRTRALRRLVWLLALSALLLWSLLAAGTHALFVGGTTFVEANLHWLESMAWLEPWLGPALHLTEGIAVTLTWTVWALGAACILLGAWAVPKVLGLFRAGATP